MEPVSLVDLTIKIEELTKVRDSLKREIDQNFFEASGLRENIKALSEKIAIERAELIKSHKEVESKRIELGSIDQLIDKENKLMESEKRDVESAKSRLASELAIFHKEKSGALEAIDDQRKKLNRLEVALLNREKDLKDAERNIEGQIGELAQRRLAIQEKELSLQAKDTEVSKKIKESELKLSLAEKYRDEAQAEKVRYTELSSATKKREAEFAEKDAQIRTCYGDIDIRKNRLDDRERDIVINEGKLSALRVKVSKEIEVARISATKKDELTKELN